MPGPLNRLGCGFQEPVKHALDALTNHFEGSRDSDTWEGEARPLQVSVHRQPPVTLQAKVVHAVGLTPMWSSSPPGKSTSLRASMASSMVMVLLLMRSLHHHLICSDLR